MKALWRDGNIDRYQPGRLENLLEQAWESDCDFMVVIVSLDGKDADIYRDDEKLPSRDGESYGGNVHTLALRLRGAIHNW